MEIVKNEIAIVNENTIENKIYFIKKLPIKQLFLIY